MFTFALVITTRRSTHVRFGVIARFASTHRDRGVTARAQSVPLVDIIDCIDHRSIDRSNPCTLRNDGRARASVASSSNRVERADERTRGLSSRARYPVGAIDAPRETDSDDTDGESQP
jgi:hypothetical protein